MLLLCYYAAAIIAASYLPYFDAYFQHADIRLIRVTRFTSRFFDADTAVAMPRAARHVAGLLRHALMLIGYAHAARAMLAKIRCCFAAAFDAAAARFIMIITIVAMALPARCCAMPILLPAART